jgi:gliding motility-associated protein GldM
MALPKEPRQKMINIMYLVLTAILALNVSSEILNAFKTFDDSFGKSNIALRARSEKLIGDFDAEQNKSVPAEKIAEWKPRAIKIRDLSEEIYQHIDNLKLELQKESGLEADGKYKEDDLEATTRLLVEGKAKSNVKRGEELYALIAKYKVELGKIDPSIYRKISSVPLNLNIPKLYNKDDEVIVKKMTPSEQWSYIYFHMTPTIAAMAMLSKFQNDIRSTQTQLIEFCYSQINTVELPPNSFGVIASANATTVTPGDALEITAGLGAYNSESKPNISIDGQSVPIGPDGKAIYKMTASAAGEYTKRVSITYTNPITGKQETKTSDVKFKVVIPSGLTVSTDATRVFYVGVPKGNPISVSGASGAASAISVSVASGNARIQNIGAGRFSVFPNSEGDVVLNVSDGKTTKRDVIPAKLPPPPVMILGDGTSYGSLTKSALIGSIGVVSELKNFIFKDIEYPVQSFKVAFDNGKVFTSGASFSGQIISEMNNLEPGDHVLIYNIVYKGVDGKPVVYDQAISINIY